jgi:hypothetical protein
MRGEVVRRSREGRGNTRAEGVSPSGQVLLALHLLLAAIFASLALGATQAGAVAGGEPVGAGVLPSVVPLLDPGVEDPGAAQFCAGTVVRGNWVLTAAHCVYDDSGRRLTPGEIQIGLGSQRLSEINRRVGVARVIVYPRYRFFRFGRDVALLEPTEFLGVPDLPLDATRNRPGSRLGPNRAGAIVGWGGTEAGLFDSLLFGVATIYGRDTCLRGIKAPWGTICATTPDSGESAACSGDSGGPLLALRNGQFFLTGLVSFGPDYCSRGNTAVYSDAAFYSSWVARVTRGQDPRVGLPEAQSVYAKDEGRNIVFRLNWSQANAAGHRIRIDFIATPVQGGKKIRRQIFGRMPRGNARARASVPDVFRNGRYIVSVKVTDLTAKVVAFGPLQRMQVRNP